MPQSYRELARPSFGDARWLETNWFSALTDQGLRLHIWVGFRTNLGVVMSRVYAYTGHAATVADMAYYDAQYHLPIHGARLGRYDLDTGVSVRAVDPGVHYDVRLRTRRLAATLDIRALMPPVGIHDIALAGSDGFTAFQRRSDPGLPEDRAGLEPSGHIDQTMHVTGTVELDGAVHAVDCVANRDHSWSSRPEFGGGIGSFDLLHFGPERSILLQTTRDPRDGATRATHAYVLDGGRVLPAAEVAVEHVRERRHLRAATYRVVTVDGEVFEARAERPASSAEFSDGNAYTVLDLLDAESAGRPGYLESMWHADTPMLQRMVAAGEL
jgi:hypothetical protein